MLAPMAGVTDLPFRTACLSNGAGYAVAEMVTSKPGFADTSKSYFRTRIDTNNAQRQHPVAMQIVGYDPAMMATSAREHVDLGADIIDINMGCPAKKVCNVASGSSLLRDEPLVAAILTAVVAAVDVPVTLKIRTGWCRESRNAVRIAQLAESAGIQMLTIHGRTREDKFAGHAEYQTIAEVVKSVSIPVIANGDITSAEQAASVLSATGAAGVMIGRAAQGRPWLFRELSQLASCQPYPSLSPREMAAQISQHIQQVHDFYREPLGVRMARKHIRWYLSANAKQLNCRENWQNFWHTICRENNPNIQHAQLVDFLGCSAA